MRDILVDYARQKTALKRGGNRHRIPLSDDLAVSPQRDEDVLALDEVWPEFRPVGYQVSGPGGNRTCIAMYSKPAVECVLVSQRSCASETYGELPLLHSANRCLEIALAGIEPATSGL